MRFVARPLGVPHTAVVETGAGLTVFVRFLASDAGARTISVLPDAVQEVGAVVRDLRESGKPFERVLIVGADKAFDPRYADAEGQKEAVADFANLLTALAAQQIPVTWRTRAGVHGAISSTLADAFVACGRLATVEIGVPSLDADLCRMLEGNGSGAHPADRLRLAAAASARGVPVCALLDPLVPMLTDQMGALRGLFGELSEAGVHRAKVRYLVLTRDRAQQLTAHMPNMNRALIRGCFAEERWQQPNEARGRGPREAHKLMPPRLRQQGHHRAAVAANQAGLILEVLDPATEDELLEVPSPQPSKKRRPQLDLFGRR